MVKPTGHNDADGTPASHALSADAVVRAHAPSIYKHLKRIFGPASDVDDQLQAVLLEIVRYLPSFEGRAQLSTWIYRITLSVAYQELRVRQRIGRREVAIIDLDDDTGAHLSDGAGGLDEAGASDAEARAHLRSAHDEVQRKQECALLYRALDSLSAKKRLAVVLYEIEGLTLREISEMLTVPLQTVASQVRMGRAQLADAMRDLVNARPAASAQPHAGTNPSAKTGGRP